MYNKKFLLLLLLLGLTGGIIFAGGAKELALDDTWSVSSLETGDTIRKNLDEWIEVLFDSDSNTVRIATGSAWPELLQGIDGVFTYKMSGDHKSLYLQKEGETIYTIDVEISNDLQKMHWVEWKRGDLDLVGNGAPIECVTFTRS
jgi:hypothetical protein